MNTLELTECFTQYQILNRISAGVFSRDNIPAVDRHPFCFIVNSDKSNQPGKHWMAIFVDGNNKAEFFDSYGMRPTGNIKKYLEKFYFDSNSYNKQRIQGAFSTTCGQYCLCYIFFRSVGVKLNQFLNLFSKDDFHYNDHFINKLCRYYFDLDKKVFENSQLNQICISLNH